MVQGRDHLSTARQGLLRRQRRRRRRLSGVVPQARLFPGSRRHRVVAAAVLPLAAARRRLRHFGLQEHQSVLWPDGRFQSFVREAHRRNLRIITELIINHTSDQHPWFQRARRAKPGSSLRDFYVWSDTDQKFPETRIIFVDTEKSNWAWDPVAQAYYWHRFYSHQPDLNFDNPRVLRAICRRDAVLARSRRRRDCGSTRCPI